MSTQSSTIVHRVWNYFIILWELALRSLQAG